MHSDSRSGLPWIRITILNCRRRGFRCARRLCEPANQRVNIRSYNALYSALCMCVSPAHFGDHGPAWLFVAGSVQNDPGLHESFPGADPGRIGQDGGSARPGICGGACRPVWGLPDVPWPRSGCGVLWVGGVAYRGSGVDRDPGWRSDPLRCRRRKRAAISGHVQRHAAIEAAGRATFSYVQPQSGFIWHARGQGFESLSSTIFRILVLHKSVNQVTMVRDFPH